MVSEKRVYRRISGFKVIDASRAKVFCFHTIVEDQCDLLVQISTVIERGESSGG